MNETHTELGALARRLELLERSTHRWKALATASTLGLVGLGALAAAPAPVKELTVERLVVRSPGAKSFVRIDPGAIEVRSDEKGGASVQLRTDALPADGHAVIRAEWDGRAASLSATALGLFDPIDEEGVSVKPGLVQLFHRGADAEVVLTHQEGRAGFVLGPPGGNVVKAWSERGGEAGLKVSSNGKTAQLPGR